MDSACIGSATPQNEGKHAKRLRQARLFPRCVTGKCRFQQETFVEADGRRGRRSARRRPLRH